MILRVFVDPVFQAGYINLFTLRHDPGRLIHVMNGHHRTPISALCLDYDEKGFFSAGWDGVAIVSVSSLYTKSIVIFGATAMGSKYGAKRSKLYRT